MHHLVVDDRARVRVELATTARTRRRGLLGRDGLDGALWLEPCKQVHTLRMRFTLDVAYVDREGRVLVVRRLPPGRLGPLRPRAQAVVEATAGAFAEWGLTEGSVVRVEPAPGS